jgi:hypothetical protein
LWRKSKNDRKNLPPAWLQKWLQSLQDGSKSITVATRLKAGYPIARIFQKSRRLSVIGSQAASSSRTRQFAAGSRPESDSGINLPQKSSCNSITARFSLIVLPTGRWKPRRGNEPGI